MCSFVNCWRSGSAWLVSPPGRSVQRNVVDGALTRSQRLLRAVVVDKLKHRVGGRGVYCLCGEFPKIFLDRVKHHLLHEERVSSLEVSFLFPSMFFWLNLPWDLIDQVEQHDLNDSRECKHYLVFLLDWRGWRLDSGHTLVPLGNPRILRHPEILLHPFYSRTNHLLQQELLHLLLQLIQQDQKFPDSRKSCWTDRKLSGKGVLI